jgi:cell division protein FtsB
VAYPREMLPVIIPGLWYNGHMYPQNLLREQVSTEKKKRSFVFHTVITIIILYLSWLLIFDEHSLLRYSTLKKKRKEIIAQIVDLQKNNTILRENVRLLSEEPFYIEKFAREELSLSRPDEFVFIFDK